jgi:hypothetical protein
MWFVLISLFFAASVAWAGESTLMGPLKNQKVAQGCGCGFARTGARPPLDYLIFASKYQGPAWVNIRGQDTKLEPLDPNVLCMLERLGDRCAMRFKGAGINVVIDVSATWVCPDDPDDESCEVTKLEGNLTITMGKARELQSVVGGCGC